MTMETARLVLKPHQPENAARLHVWQNDDEILYYNADSIRHQTEQETAQALARWMDTSRSGIEHCAIHIKETDEFIGFAMLAFIDHEHHRCKVAITIGEKHYWDRGYGREALQRLVDHSFEDLNMNRIGAEIFAINERSIRLFEKVGFRREGAIRENVLKDGTYIDEYAYGLLRSEWQKTRAAGAGGQG